MRLRQPDPEINVPANVLDISTAEHSVTYQVTTITPIFGGGVEAGVPDKDMPIRASAIRGQLRYWWRFLASHRNEEPITDYKELFKHERKLWGGMGEKGEDYSSKVFVRVHKVSHRSINAYDGMEAGYALFPARDEGKLIRENVRFSLTITMPVDNVEEMKKVIRWWMTFGGIGSRIRRGVGSIDIKKLEPIDVDEAGRHGCKLVLRKNYNSDALTAWKKAVEYLEIFRQKDVGRNGTFGRSRWPEPDSIREITDKHSANHIPEHGARCSFPRAYFGLPIIFKFKDDGEGDPQQLSLLSEKSKRLASPLILTPYRKPNGNYTSAALCLPYEQINDCNLLLTREDNKVTNMPCGLTNEQQKDWEDKNWPKNWWDSSKAKYVYPIKNYEGKDKETNPLGAFMNYFDEGNS